MPFRLLLLLSGLLVLASHNPVHSVLFLILVFLNGAGLLLLLGLDFLALLLLVVYVGAVAVLFLFIVMMLHLKLVRLGQSLFHHAPVAAAALALLGLGLHSLLEPTLGGPLSAVGWVVRSQQADGLTALGWVLYTHHWVPLLLASLVLLVALVGAIVLTFDRSAEPTGHRQQVYLQVVRSNRLPLVQLNLFLSMSLGFSTSVSPIMEGIVDLHNHIFFFLVLIFVFVFWLFSQILLRFWWAVRQSGGDPLADRRSLVALRHLNHSTLLEIVWTVVPSLILVAVAVPSFALLYAMDEVLEPTLTLKAVGHQWYWSYQYSNCVASLQYVPLEQPGLVPHSLWEQLWFQVLHHTSRVLSADDLTTAPYPTGAEDPVWFRHWWVRKFINAKMVEALSAPVTLVDGPSLPTVSFDSYMLAEEELAASSDYRLLQVDEPVVLPANTHVRLLVTAEDVIHSFALPSAGVKLDAVPGRLNQQGLFLKRQGTFYGQCSELCGVNHGFMPIVVKGVSMREFVHWYLTKLQLQQPSLHLLLAEPEQVQAWLKTGDLPINLGNPARPIGNPPHPQAALLDAANGLVLHQRVEELLEGLSQELLDNLWNREVPDFLPWSPPLETGFRLGAPVPHPFPYRVPGAYQQVSLASPGDSRWW